MQNEKKIYDSLFGETEIVCSGNGSGLYKSCVFGNVNRSGSGNRAIVRSRGTDRRNPKSKRREWILGRIYRIHKRELGTDGSDKFRNSDVGLRGGMHNFCDKDCGSQ